MTKEVWPAIPTIKMQKTCCKRSKNLAESETTMGDNEARNACP